MGVIGKLEVEVDIKCHGDLFHELVGKKPHHVPNIIPHKIHSCNTHDGELGKPGCVLSWDYTHDGKKCFAKAIVEAIDEENKLVRYKNIEGDLINDFKSITIIAHVIVKGEITTVKWTAEFEKITDDGPYPTKIINYCIELTRDIESHHLKA